VSAAAPALQLVKLGGSVLTDKTRYRTARPDALRRLAEELARAPGPLVLVHGAGSFGHVLAKEHRLAEGDDGDAARRTAFARVHDDVRALDALVRAALLDAHLAPLSHSTFDLARLCDGRLAHFDVEPVRATLGRAFLPVLRGDGVPDETRGFGILSGDVLMVELARTLRPARCVFVTDVDGIFDRDPRETGARLLPRVSLAEAPAAGAAKGDDVTGGMRGKLERAAEVARLGMPVLVVNGLVPGRLAEALSGGSPVGTVVEP
jgi:isopentenyl phosphate kinase